MPNANLLGEMCMRANLSAQVCGADLLGEKFMRALLSAQVWLVEALTPVLSRSALQTCSKQVFMHR